MATLFIHLMPQADQAQVQPINIHYPLLQRHLKLLTDLQQVRPLAHILPQAASNIAQWPPSRLLAHRIHCGLLLRLLLALGFLGLLVVISTASLLLVALIASWPASVEVT